MWFFYLFVAFAILLLVVVNAKYLAERQELAESAQQQYLRCLSSLKKEPENAELRQSTLEFGRIYLRLSRVSDEAASVALMSDITAACAETPQAILAPTTSGDFEARLHKLQDLKAKGLTV